ncbi:MAG: ATP-dependent zinc protease [Lysobacterales bacterium]
MSALIIIGWREWVGLPELGLPGIKAKIDTGAKTSALHAHRVRTERRDGELWARFFVHPEQKKRHPEVACEARVVDERAVRSSNGKTETRLTICCQLRLGPYQFPADVTLTNRDEMGFRMLIGRSALKRHFIVNSGLSFATGVTTAADS